MSGLIGTVMNDPMTKMLEARTQVAEWTKELQKVVKDLPKSGKIKAELADEKTEKDFNKKKKKFQDQLRPIDKPMVYLGNAIDVWAKTIEVAKAANEKSKKEREALRERLEPLAKLIEILNPTLINLGLPKVDKPAELNFSRIMLVEGAASSEIGQAETLVVLARDTLRSIDKLGLDLAQELFDTTFESKGTARGGRR